MNEKGNLIIWTLGSLVILTIVIGTLVWFNNKLTVSKDSMPINNQVSTTTSKETPTENNTGTPAEPEQITNRTDVGQGNYLEIMDGSLYLEDAKGIKTLIMDKVEASKLYLNDSDTTTGEIIKLIVSPDKNKVLFLAHVGLSEAVLFYTPLKNIKVQAIQVAGEVVWSPNSRYFAYNSKIADVGFYYRLHIYDTDTDKILDASNKQKIQGLSGYSSLDYSNLKWLEDSSGLKVHYRAWDEIPMGNIVGEGNISILLQDLK